MKKSEEKRGLERERKDETPAAKPPGTLTRKEIFPIW